MTTARWPRLGRTLLGAVCAAGLMAPAANAEVTYTFTGMQTFSHGPVNPDEPFGPQIETYAHNTFTLTVANYITNGMYAPDTGACVSDNPAVTCGIMEFDNDPNQFNVGGDFLSFGFTYDDGVESFGGGSFYFFQPGAFGANGVYTNEGWPINGPPPSTIEAFDLNAQDYNCCLGNAGPATLIVSGSADNAVPEPATWGLMILGFGAVGAVIRRRRPAHALAAA